MKSQRLLSCKWEHLSYHTGIGSLTFDLKQTLGLIGLSKKGIDVIYEPKELAQK